MKKPEEMGLTFLIITLGFWDKGDNILKLKRRAAQSRTKSDKKVPYLLYLVQADTVIENEQFKFTSELAKKTAMFLGEI